MFKSIEWIREIPKQKRIKRFIEERRFELNGAYGFSVGGLLVRDFCYLLRHVTNGKHDSFVNFEKIADSFVAIDSAIVIEMNKPTPREEEINFTNHEGAILNLQNLRYIVHCIAEYVGLARELGLPTNPKVH